MRKELVKSHTKKVILRNRVSINQLINVFQLRGNSRNFFSTNSKGISKDRERYKGTHHVKTFFRIGTYT